VMKSSNSDDHDEEKTRDDVISLPLAGVSMPFTEIFNIGSTSRFLYWCQTDLGISLVYSIL
jgi:hypothetical protein